MPQIEFNNHCFFTSVDEMVDNASKIMKYFLLNRVRQLCPQVTVIFENSNDEALFCSRLYNLLKQYEFIEFYSSGLEVLPERNAVQFHVSLHNMEKVINRLTWYPAPGGMPLINRRPTDIIIALYISAFAASRNFYLITTLIDQNRSNQAYYLQQCVQ